MAHKITLRPEDLLHKQFCDYLQLQYPGIVIHHSPNEGKRTWFAQYLMTILRVSRGFPDLFLVYKGKAIAPELKATKPFVSKRTGTVTHRATSTATEDQLRWVEVLNSARIPSRVCVGMQEAMFFVDIHFGPLK